MVWKLWWLLIKMCLLQGLKDYKELDLCNSGIDDEQVAPLLEALKDENNIQILNLSNNKIRVIISLKWLLITERYRLWSR